MFDSSVAKQYVPKRFVRIKLPVEVREGMGPSLKWARLEPFAGAAQGRVQLPATFEDGDEQLLLAGEIVIEHPLAGPGACRDRVDDLQVRGLEPLRHVQAADADVEDAQRQVLQLKDTVAALRLRLEEAEAGRAEAVHGLNLVVPTGSVFALLGPNGAGKTTTIKMLVNLLQPTSGTARISLAFLGFTEPP